MTIKTTETLILTQEDRAFLEEVFAFINRIYDHSSIHGELENLANAVDSALCDLLNYEYLEIE